MIELCNVTKTYHNLTALDDVSLALDNGICLGLVGTNGAGRSTLLNIVGTLLRATSGRVTVAGLDVRKHTLRIRRQLGYVGQSHLFPNGLTVGQYLAFMAATHGLRSAHQTRAIASVLAQTDLNPEFNLQTLSRGYQQQLAVATALLHDPAVLLLDEPLAYLDPLARIRVRGILRQQRMQGKTILLACNDADDVDGLCDRIALLHRGRLLAMLEDASEMVDLPATLASCVAHDDTTQKRAMQ